MKRSQLKAMHSGKKVIITNLELQTIPSVTDPTLAFNGRQILEMANRGVLPSNNMRYYQGVPIDHMMPIDNPNVDIFQGMEYAKERVSKTKGLIGKINDVATKETKQKDNPSTTAVESTN